MASKKDGKKARKVGRTARRPGTARRKFARPDLFRKARKTLQSCGEAFLVKVWTPDRIDYEERVNRLQPEQAGITVRKARDAALSARS
jgi:hypothetical protein